MMSACARRRARPALGTLVEIAVSGGERAALDRAIDAGFAAIERVHALMSFHEPTSDLARLNRARPRHDVAVDPWTWQVLATALELQHHSGGVFDVAIAPALQAAGILPGEGAPPRSRQRVTRAAGFALPAPCRARLMREGAALDLGGIAKGFAVVRAVAALKRNGIAAGLVNAGGDLAVFGPGAQPVDIRDPRDPARILACIDAENEAVASSAGQLDPFVTATMSRSAIVDPTRGDLLPAGCGATVRAGSCMIADALTKVVMVAGERAGPMLRRYGAAALLMTGDGELCASGDWPERLRLAS